jgi:hypothetical protein
MSITAEKIARREMMLLESPDKVPVAIRLRKVNDFLLPHREGEVEATAVFKIWTYGDNQIIEEACKYPCQREDGKFTDQIDVNEMRRLMVKRSLMDWSLPIEIERDNGWLTPKCYEQVGKVPAPVMEALLWEFEKSFMITEKEEKTISKQCAVLFNKSSRGVSDACEAVSLFCTYGNFSEKFGIDREQLPDIPFKEYQLLRMVMGREGEAIKRESNKKDHHANTRVAMGGTKARASRGKRIALR